VVEDKAEMEFFRAETSRILQLLIRSGIMRLVYPNYKRYLQEIMNGKDVVFRNAPHLIAAATPANAPCKEADPWIALSYFDLFAQTFGVGTCWCGFGGYAFRWNSRLRKRLDLPRGYKVGAVLLFGPLYHLHSRADRLQCIAEARRVCKPGGKLFFAFISNDFVILTEFSYRPDYFTAGDYDKETFQLEDFPFVFHTVDDCRALLRDGGVRILHEVASDGVSELLEERINGLDAENYAQYLRYHFHICEKPELLGMTNHLLFVAE